MDRRKKTIMIAVSLIVLFTAIFGLFYINDKNIENEAIGCIGPAMTGPGIIVPDCMKKIYED